MSKLTMWLGIALLFFVILPFAVFCVRIIPEEPYEPEGC